MNQDFERELASRAFDLSEPQKVLLERYAELLWDWNNKLNLTRHTTFDRFVGRDLVDANEVAKCIEAGQTVLDVGSGGGVPGIPLAILREDLEVSLCESVGKKAAALNEIVSELKLPIVIHNCRVEDLLDEIQFDVLTARAVGPLWKIAKWLQPHWNNFGQLLAIKGPRWVEERGEARHKGLLNDVALRKLASYPMEGADSDSVILQLQAKPS